MNVTVSCGVLCLKCVEEHHEKANMIAVSGAVESEWGFTNYKCPVCGAQIQLNVAIRIKQS